MEIVCIALLKNFLHSVDFHLSDVYLILVLSYLELCFFMNLLLSGCDTIELRSHVLYLARLGTLNVCITPDLHVTFFNLSLCRFILFCHFSLSLLSLCKLYLNIAERVLQLLILNFT